MTLNIPSDREFIVPMKQDGEDLYAIFPYDRRRVNSEDSSFSLDGGLTLEIDMEKTVRMPVSVTGKLDDIKRVHCLDYTDVRPDDHSIEDLTNPETMDPVNFRTDQAVILEESSDRSSMDRSNESGQASTIAMVGTAGVTASAGLLAGWVDPETIDYMNQLATTYQPYLESGMAAAKAGGYAVAGAIGKSLWDAAKSGAAQSETAGRWESVRESVSNTFRDVADQFGVTGLMNKTKALVDSVRSVSSPIQHPENPDDPGADWTTTGATYAETLKNHIDTGVNDSIGLEQFSPSRGVNAVKGQKLPLEFHTITEPLKDAGVDFDVLEGQSTTLLDLYQTASDLGDDQSVDKADMMTSIYKTLRTEWINHPDGGAPEDFAGKPMDVATTDEKFFKRLNRENGPINYDYQDQGFAVNPKKIRNSNSPVTSPSP